ncbi:MULTISPECIES: diacylglycerol kinase [unclassified Robiginitalea]|uniref:diacylglycerol kinase n=1 Tax=Robiginitalea TaxID=252306 RepID=UPI0023493094|nr:MULTISPECIES: diacylglycerol kinase family protein [unclassified Robiginitalea]MDC6353935.1 diacylglycerol kinase family protein [Robiginitalea sp. PM2]MDC6374202.1 diacylglycerol kinase family protein [Robiginitalea sp. SP8]
MPEESFTRNRIKSVGIAMRGAWLLVRTEGSIQIQAVIALVVTAAGFYFSISATEWMFQLLAIGLVMGVEGVNTAIEKLSDYVQPEYDERIGRLKDMSAGAVMITSILASIVGLIIYLPKLF